MPVLPWTTPKAPPSHDGPVTVMASRLELRRLSDVPSFLVAALRIRRQTLSSPGALGVSLIARPARRTFWTLSAWQDQAALAPRTARRLDNPGTVHGLGQRGRYHAIRVELK